MRVHLIVIGLAESGACSGRNILTNLVYERYNVRTGLAAVCGNFVDPEGNGWSAPNETMICALMEDLDQPGAQGSCYTTLSAWGKLEEMFVQSLSQVSLEQSTDKRILQYNDLAEIVDSIDTLQFLQDIIPKKIKAKVYLDMMKQLEAENGGDNDET